MNKSHVIGIDEVGRGSLAGPVVVCAALISKSLKTKTFTPQSNLKDSKKLSPSQREKWFNFFKNNQDTHFAIAKIHPPKIDKINISRAANLAALRAYLRLIKNLKFKIPKSNIYLDGGLYLGNGKNRIAARTIIKGDERIPAIMIASIIAKVSRDRLMARLAKKHPKYGFEIHKGYGTKRHLVALKKFGPSEIHRLTFLG